MNNLEVESLKALPPCHPELVEAIITQIKSQGLFDDFRKSCLSDIDTKPSYLNLKQRVEGYVNKFLGRQQWSSTLQRNQLRETLRKDINESGLLKTGLDHLVDQLIYAHAEKSIRPKVRAEIKRFLNLTEASDEQSTACVPSYPIAAPPHYGLPAMPPLPPVPPPPDVTGAMMDTFGNLKPPEPPSPHGSEYSVDMSDSSMVGRDEAPPAIPNRTTIGKPDLNGGEIICNDSMDIEDKEEQNQGQTPVQCSSPEIFEEVSEGGSLGGTPVRDEDASDSEPRTEPARTDFTGLFKDSASTSEQPTVNESEVIIDEESMVFEVSEEYVKTEEATKNEEDVGTPLLDDEAPLSQGGDLEQTNMTPIMDEAPPDNDDMQISSDDETQCEDEVQSPGNETQQDDKSSDVEDEAKKSSIVTEKSCQLIDEEFRGSLDAELSDTQPPLQIDTEDTGFTVIEKDQADDGQEADRVADVTEKASPLASDAINEPSTPSPDKTDAADGLMESSGVHEESQGGIPRPEKSDHEGIEDHRVDVEMDEESLSAADSKAKVAKTPHRPNSPPEASKDSKHKQRRSSSHHKTSSRSESERDRRREHKSSSSNHHASSSTSSKWRKLKDHEQSRSRDRESTEKRDDKSYREHSRKKERDGKSRDRDRSERDSKTRSSSHSHRKHSRHHQDRRRDDDRKVQSSTTSGGSNKASRSKNEDTCLKTDTTMPTSEKIVSETAVPVEEETTTLKEEEIPQSPGNLQIESDLDRGSQSELPESATLAASHASPEPPRMLSPEPSPAVASSSSLKCASEEDLEVESERPLKKRKRKFSKQQDTLPDPSRASAIESKDSRKEASTSKGRRRSSAASVTSQQSVETLDQPESPVPSKFGRQRKINPKYEDDGTLSALLFGK